MAERWRKSSSRRAVRAPTPLLSGADVLRALIANERRRAELEAQRQLPVDAVLRALDEQLRAQLRTACGFPLTVDLTDMATQLRRAHPTADVTFASLRRILCSQGATQFQFADIPDNSSNLRVTGVVPT